MQILSDPTRMIAFAVFSAVVAGTPGPSNTMLTAVGARVGVRRGLASLLGQAAGMGAMLLATILGLGNLLLAHPSALQILRWGGTAALCWMAWRIATAKPTAETTTAPAGFLSMAAFQWINPKGWLIGVTATATHLDRHAGYTAAQAIVLTVLFTLVALLVCLPWLAFGAALQYVMRTPRARRFLNGAMAVLLLVSTIPLVFSAH